MDKDTFIRVKLAFRAQCKLAKFYRAIDTSFSSMKNLRKLIFKHFPEIEEMVDRPPRTTGVFSPTHLLTIKCKDTVGDYITLESEDDLDAMELLEYDNVDFCIDVIPIASPATQIPSNRSPRISSSLQSDKPTIDLYRKMTLCRNFQSGFCRHGEGCRFAHDPAKLARQNWFPSNCHTGTMDSTTVEVQRPVWRGSRSQGRLSPLVGHPVLRAGNPDEPPDQQDRSVLRQEADYSCWVKQTELDSPNNIEYLSGADYGYPMLSRFVNETNVPHKTIALFVKLLAREEIRTSLLRQQTNRIYGILTGSRFLLQLNDHIESHLGMMPTLEPQDVRPYLALTEELQSRTIEGWKDAPLIALKIVVSKLEESTAKNDLLAIVSRLDYHCERVQRFLAVSQTKQQHVQEEDFRKISIVPGKEELVEFQSKQNLPVIGIGIQYSRVRDYLESHFRLLREDCIDPLRNAIKTYRSTHKNTNGDAKDSGTSAFSNLRIYPRVQLAGILCGEEGVEFVVSFHVSASEETPESWVLSKKLMFGALLCISSDGFETFFLAVVGRRDVKELAQGLIGLRIIGESDAKFTEGLRTGRASTEAYVMVEANASYFEASCSVLSTLQRQELENIPFTPHLLHLEPSLSPPSYLQRRKGGDEYDFSCAFPDIHEKLGKTRIRITQSEWPSGWTDSLDRIQQDALKQGLTKELAIIQGPPGTGKTFLGLILMKILLANLKQSPGQTWAKRNEEACDLTGPILVICYSNHALDQFLEGIFRDGERKLIRIGRQGKSDILKNNTLQSLLKQQRMDRRVNRSHQRLFDRGSRDKALLESKIRKCIDAMGVKLITHSMLDRIATWEQKQSLFCIDQANNRSSTNIVKLWLTGMDHHLAQHVVAIDLDDHASDDLWESTAEKRSRGSIKLLPKSEAHEDREWMEVWRRRRTGSILGAGLEPDEDPDVRDGRTRLHIADEGQAHDHSPDHYVTNSADGGPIEEAVRLAPDVWQLTLPQRMMLHEHWLEQQRKLQQQELRMLTKQYEEACKGVKEVENEIKLSMLRMAKVVGMTTSAAAKHYDVLKSLKPEIVIVEEAAEVLEGHILACISPSVKHLILIGDHLQLRPTVSVDELAIKNKLDLSMFERLVRSGVEHVTLQEQRRMRPNISKLVGSLYPGLRDHESVGQYEDVSGMNSNVYFFDRKAEEDSDSGSNSTEAKLVVELCLYLLNQGCYRPENIAILAMYTGQLQEIKTLLQPRILSTLHVNTTGAQPCQDPGAEEITLLPRVNDVHEYQGEESDIIILSLASSSNSIVTKEDGGKVGFLNMSNRICVALTRARKGLFIFGNADLLAGKSILWKDVTTRLRNSGELGPQLELHCQNHPDIITRITSAEDFKQVEDGGCCLPCEHQLACGHVCPRRCHPGSHDLILCPKPCLRQHDDCHHFCNFGCHGSEDCPPCTVVVTKKMPHCEHEQGMECSNDPTDVVWRRRSHGCNVCLASSIAAEPGLDGG